MALMVRAYPFSGTDSQLQEFLAWVRLNQAKVSDMYSRYEITHESWHKQIMGTETFVIGVAIARDPATAADALGKSQNAFDVEFKRRVQALTTTDMKKHPAGPPTEMIYDFSDPSCPQHSLGTI